MGYGWIMQFVVLRFIIWLIVKLLKQIINKYIYFTDHFLKKRLRKQFFATFKNPIIE
jgi:hypothetical protein